MFRVTYTQDFPIHLHGLHDYRKKHVDLQLGLYLGSLAFGSCCSMTPPMLRWVSGLPMIDALGVALQISCDCTMMYLALRLVHALAVIVIPFASLLMHAHLTR